MSASVILPCIIKVQKIFFWHWLTRVVPEKGPSNSGGGMLFCQLILDKITKFYINFVTILQQFGNNHMKENCHL